MKTLMTLTGVVTLLAVTALQADEMWRAATPRAADNTATANLPVVESSGIVPTDEDVLAPVVRTTAPTEVERATTATFTTVSAAKVVVDHRDSVADEVTVGGEVADVDYVVPAALVNTPLVRKGSYVRPISEAEMWGEVQTVSEVRTVAQLEPVPTTTPVPATPIPATVAPSTSYYASATTVYQPTVSTNPCCDPCNPCNPCQTYVSTPVTTYQPVAACPTGLCKQPTLRPGLWGQPSVHIDGQPIRNAIRWLVP